jgi:predicted amidophosphoribosyltransferase
MALADLLTPSRCLACRAPGPALCAACDAALPRLRAPFCALCGVPTELPVPRCRDCARRRPGFAAARAACLLEGPAARLVRAWKDRGLAAVAALAAAEVVAALSPPAVDALVCVPPARARVRRRGVDGPAALTALLGATWGLPVATGALVRVDAVPQRERGGAARRSAARGAFRAVGRPPPRLLLVDDVLTTGATADACARELRRLGAARVEVAVFARTPRRG